MKPKTPDEYLKAVSAGKRVALETLRKNIKAAAPTADLRPPSSAF